MDEQHEADINMVTPSKNCQVEWRWPRPSEVPCRDLRSCCEDDHLSSPLSIRQVRFSHFSAQDALAGKWTAPSLPACDLGTKKCTTICSMWPVRAPLDRCCTKVFRL
ncbi:unnamed protein product [Pleuronectes platessa]|uniref:Uncharacterized protein n=1 Tax=Pleuronectes platessa TaxID=8262 RepID=A0A9N7TI85_PLEPL|nr:unnamed protein product [Pleuronectes platessa]